MPLVSIISELKKAQAKGYAVPLFDLFELSGCEDLYIAALNKQAPVIAGMYNTTFDRPASYALAACHQALAQKAPGPVSLMLDHGSSLEQCLQALELGFTDVMFDGSTLPLEENIAITRQLVTAAHAKGAGVEAELGHVGTGKDYTEFGGAGKGFTDPDKVELFIKETKVDMLAIAIGTAHGAYKGTPQLDLDLLAKIRQRTDVPLVLHGGTGLSEDQFRSAIKTGIAKVNIATDLVKASGTNMAKVAQESDSFFKITKALHTTIQERCGYYLDLFGASGQAG
jgi:fructose-bisphosphate aldolase class II